MDFIDLINRIIYNLTQVHPVHTLIVHFPIALVSSGLFFILLALWRRSDALEQVAFANIALASVSTVVAAITGMLDNTRIYDGAAPNAAIKITLACILFLVTAYTTLIRWRNPRLFHTLPQRNYYVAAYVVSFILVAVLGFLGGVILYGFQSPVTEAPVGSTPVAAVTTDIPGPGPTLTLAVPGDELSGAAAAGEDEPTAIAVSFSRDVQPLLESRCLKCHGGQKTEKGMNVSTYERLMAGGRSGPSILPGDATNSHLIELVQQGKMPKSSPRLPDAQIQLLIDWVNAGALNN